MNSADRLNWIKLTASLVVLALLFGFLTDTPAYEVLASDQTEFKIVIRHSGKLFGECRVITAEEIASTPPNMRRPTECPRGKAAIAVTLSVDNKPLINKSVQPSGLHDDGVLAMFEKVPLPVGLHHFDIKVAHQMIEGAMTDSFSGTLNVVADRIVIAEYTDAGFRLYQPGVTQ